MIKKIQRAFTSLKQVNEADLCLFIDTETREGKIQDDITRLELKVGYAELWSYKQNKLLSNLYFYSPKQFWDWLKIISKGKKTLIFAHNMGFDINVLQFTYFIKKKLYGSKMIDIRGNFILNIKPDKDTTWLFLDSTNYYGKVSLEYLSSLFGEKKVKIDDFKNVTMKVLEQRVKQDTILLKKLMFYFFDFLKEHQIPFRYSIAGCSLAGYRHNFYSGNIFLHDNKKATDLEIQSYYGGRTESFQLGRIRERVYKLDINSMYPSIMKNESFPIRFIKLLEGDKANLSLNALRELLRDYYILINADVSINEPFLPIKYEKKLLFPIGEFNTSIGSPEVELLIEKGKILKIYKISVYEKGKLFGGYVDYFYNVRQMYKKQENGIMEKISKIFLNSLYGKFGQRSFEMIKVLEGNFKFYIEIGKHYFLYTPNGLFKQADEKSVGYFTFVAIASAVTSYARANLYRYMEQAKDVFYVDTDSIFTSRAGVIRMRDKLDNKKLGYLKIEEVGGNVNLKGLKDYTFLKDVKIKGVPKKAIKIDDNTYKYTQFLKTPVLLRKDYNGVGTREMTKVLTRKYTKRIVHDDGTTEPVRLLL